MVFASELLEPAQDFDIRRGRERAFGELGLGSTPGHPKTLWLIEEYLQRFESPYPRTAETSN
ncbi:MAG TPA: hypothetical protein VGC05_12225 [Mycobacterium sp.]